HRHGLELTLRHRRAKRVGGERRQNIARCLQERTGGTLVRRGDGKPRSGAVLSEQRGLPEICAAADRGGQAAHRRAGLEAAGLSGSAPLLVYGRAITRRLAACAATELE